MTYEDAVVAIPARDEAATIAECLRSIDGAAERTACKVVTAVAADSCVDGTAALANLNVPGQSDLAGTRLCPLDDVGSLRLATTAVGRLDFELAQTETGPQPGSDRHLIAQGFATVTLLSGIGEARNRVRHPPAPR